MNKIKRLFSSVLACALMLHTVVGIYPMASAEDEAASANEFIRMEAETYGVPNLYNNPNDVGTNDDGTAHTVGGAEAIENVTLPTKEELSQFLDKSNTLYVAFYVKAPEAGEYEIEPHIFLGGQYGASVPDNYRHYFLINGKKLVEGESGPNKKATVPLDKGINVIYCISYIQGMSGGWFSWDYLDVDNRLIPVMPEVSENNPLYYAKYYRNFDLNKVLNEQYGTCMNEMNKDIMKNNDVNFEMLSGNISGTLQNTAWFAETVEAPADGYYDITLEFAGNVGADKMQESIFAVVVDNQDASAHRGQYKKAAQTENTWDRNMHYVDCSVYLTKGTHVLTFTGQMPLTSQSGEDTYYTWNSFAKLTFSGGLKYALPQRDPQKPTAAPTPEAKLEAEFYGLSNQSNGIAVWNNQWGQHSGYQAVGFEIPAADKLQSKEELAAFFDKSNTPALTYYIKAEAAGTYQVKVKGACGGTGLPVDSGQSYPVTLLVNDKQVVQQNGPNSGDNFEVTLNVPLEKGINIVRCIPFLKGMPQTNDSNNSHRIEWDYLELLNTNGNAYGLAPETQFLQANKAEDINWFGNTTTEDGSLRNPYPRKVALEALSGDTLSKTPYFAYTFEASEDGCYDITMSFSCANELTEEDRYYAVVVDGKAAEKRRFNKAGNDVWDARNKANLSVWLTKGVHTLAFTAQMTSRADGDMNEWNDLFGITVYSGLKQAETSLRPDGYIAMEAETDAELSNYNNPNENMGDVTLVGGGNVTYESLKTDEYLASGADLENPYVLYRVRADQAGTYKIKPRFLIGTNGSFPEDFTPYIYVNVNGKGYKVDYLDDFDGAAVFVDLVQGENIIIVGTCSKDVYDRMLPNDESEKYFWVNQDCLLIERNDSLSPLPPEKYVRMEAETDALYYGYNNIEEWDRYSDNLALADGSYIHNALKTETELKNGDKDTVNPHAIYKVTAEAAGEYLIKPCFSFGVDGTVPAGFKPYIYIFVNGRAYKAEHSGVNSALSAPKIRAELKKGENEIFVGIYSKDVFEALGKKNCWINLDYLDIEENEKLTPVLFGRAAGLADGFTRIESETGAYINCYRAVNSGMLSGKKGLVETNYLSVQKREELKKLDESLTPFVQYEVEAPETGSYTVKFGMRYRHYGDEYPGGNKAYGAFYVNGVYTGEYELVVNDNAPHIVTLEKTLRLNQGYNLIQITGASAESISDDELSYTEVEHDYIDIAEPLIPMLPADRVEAENSEMNLYVSERIGDASGGQVAGRQDVTDVVETKITFDKLDKKMLSRVPHVTYSVIAEKAGSYTVTFGFSSMVSNPPAQPFFAVIVNNDAPQKIQYSYNTSWNMSRTVRLALKEGLNTITVTTILADVIIYPLSDQDFWINHDYIQLSAGLTAEEYVEKYPLSAGAELANLNDPLLTVQGAKDIWIDKNNGTDSAATGDNMPFTMILALFASGLGAAALCDYLKRRERKIRS